MKKIPFNIMYRPQIESGEYRVVTREDCPVEIKIWDLKGEFPVVGIYFDEKNNRETSVQVTAEGRCSIKPNDDYCDDFFIIADKTELTKLAELTEFEETLMGIVNGFGDDTMTIEGAKNAGTRLLSVACKQLEEGLPKWKKVAEVHSFDEGMSIRNTPEGGVLVLNTDGNKYFLNINELEKLPKEE